MPGPTPTLVMLRRPLAWLLLLGLLVGLLAASLLTPAGLGASAADGLGSWRWAPALLAAMA